MHDISQFKARLQANSPDLLTMKEAAEAAVSMIFRFKNASPEILLIERAHNPNDPWSGHLALPGGRREPQDESLQQTAVRETHEETGLKIKPSDYLGRLSDVEAGITRLAIACFVYKCPAECQLSLETLEVADAFWIPLSQLQTHHEIKIKRRLMSGIKEVPAVRISGRIQPLWGITLRFIREIRHLLVTE